MKLPVCLFIVFLCTRCVSGSFPKAENVTWKSINFKTFLTWQPKPSADYSHTVEYSVLGANRQRIYHCIRTDSTQCDLSTSLSDLQACYTADVLSEPPLGVTSDLTEFPHTRSPQFCPYKDTDIGKPEFKLEMSEDKTKTILHVTDPLTAVFKDGRQLSIRDIFSDQLQYKVTYRKNQSSGKKSLNSKTSVIEMTGLDQGESYCFNIQAYIPSRSIDKQLGEISTTKCSDSDKSILQGEISDCPSYITGTLLV
ncbi:coagulation factor IIIa isoform X2 [Melanotaenia boesemani]|uniref:coagulation factor IIIa isoform X2 n=1 Tax=Melanotaenia boesemani TaxID=1250792 RepID=UPI001C05320C|nr:coagulation factor IIIa isoform X2 [Melanotaenia boesemani]